MSKWGWGETICEVVILISIHHCIFTIFFFNFLLCIYCHSNNFSKIFRENARHVEIRMRHQKRFHPIVYDHTKYIIDSFYKQNCFIKKIDLIIPFLLSFPYVYLGYRHLQKHAGNIWTVVTLLILQPDLY